MCVRFLFARQTARDYETMLKRDRKKEKIRFQKYNIRNKSYEEPRLKAYNEPRTAARARVLTAFRRRRHAGRPVQVSFNYTPLRTRARLLKFIYYLYARARTHTILLCAVRNVQAYIITHTHTVIYFIYAVRVRFV